MVAECPAGKLPQSIDLVWDRRRARISPDQQPVLRQCLTSSESEPCLSAAGSAVASRTLLPLPPALAPKLQSYTNKEDTAACVMEMLEHKHDKKERDNILTSVRDACFKDNAGVQQQRGKQQEHVVDWPLLRKRWAALSVEVHRLVALDPEVMTLTSTTPLQCRLIISCSLTCWSVLKQS